jgi:SAM-dependent methyltransferase
MVLAQNNGINVINESIQNHAIHNIEKYDVVTSFQVLEHVSDVWNFIDASVACLKPGGFLILAVPSFDSFLKHVVNGVLNLPPHHVSHWSDKALIEISRRWNLDVVELHHEKVAPYHKCWQLETFYNNKLRAFFGVNKRLIDFSVTSKILRRATSLLVKYVNNPGLENEFLNGHSVTIVLRKGRQPSELTEFDNADTLMVSL